MDGHSLIYWKVIGLVATFCIVLSIPIYILRDRHLADSLLKPDPLRAGFVGSDKCQSCHKAEYDKWQTSHHQRAMAVAEENSVLGDFDDAEFEHFGVKSRFYRKNEKYFVYTQGPGGEMGEFQISHTFGWYPLQQYLIPFPGGRLQCLPIAWDVRDKKWYTLYPENPPKPDDWLYWTNQAQNWNGMCAECHSTDLQKNYDPEADAYQTTWSEISVGCEACHGPGSAHVHWAETPEMGRPLTENYGLMVKTDGLTSSQQVELCAPCHSRRMSLGENTHANNDFLDYAIPQLLSEGYYFPDGQILEEVYVYGSFMQSKMFAREVRCSDCHDVHSIKRVREGNDLCLQCHKASLYDVKDHHFHKKKGESGEPIRTAGGEILLEVGTGAQCEQCHMPGRNYMGVDYRPDHSFRIPMPDLSLKIDAPNACNRCHIDKTPQWSLDAMTQWYGKRKRSHYGTILDAGRKRTPDALPDLVRLAKDRLYPTIVRATALSLAATYFDEKSEQALLLALVDESALMRYTAIRYFPETALRQLLIHVVPLLYDPVKAVRIEAARFLSTVSSAEIPIASKKRFASVLEEYRLAMTYTADFAGSRHNLGILYSSLGDSEQAIKHYRKAIDIDREFYPAKVNLAMLYDSLGQKESAEQLLRDVVTVHPDIHEAAYAFALLLTEMKKYDEAVIYFERAATAMPQRGRVHYNLGLLLQQLERDSDAEKALAHALTTDPDNMDYLYALAQFYMKIGKLQKAKPLAEQMVSVYPNQRVGYDLLALIAKMIDASPEN